MFALCLIPIGLAIGVALDFSRGVNAQSEMQFSLDAAALAAAKPSGISKAERQKIGANHFEALYAGKFGGVVSETKFEVKKGRLEASLSGSIPTTFMRLGGKRSINISTKTAVGLGKTGGNPCFVLRFYTMQGAIRIDPQCGFHTYSKGYPSLNIYGAFANHNADTTAAGWYRHRGAFTGSQPKDYVAPIKYPDPFKGKKLPRRGACKDAHPFFWKGIPVNAWYTLRPGTYCNKMLLKRGRNYNFQPGVYILEDEIFVDGDVEIDGRGVTLLFTKKARLNIQSGGKGDGIRSNLSAPRFGPFKDILIYQAPSAADNVNTINGSLDIQDRTSGIIYLPDQDFEVNGAVALKTNNAAAFVARDWHMNGAVHFMIRDKRLAASSVQKSNKPVLLE